MTEKWLCESCKFLLAWIENKQIIRVKRKDLFIEIEGGRVTVNCVRCGKANTIKDEAYEVQTEQKGGE
jgi:hypothetical protein